MREKVKCMECGNFLKKSLKNGNVFCNNEDCPTFINDVGDLFFADKLR